MSATPRTDKAFRAFDGANLERVYSIRGRLPLEESVKEMERALNAAIADRNRTVEERNEARRIAEQYRDSELHAAGFEGIADAVICLLPWEKDRPK